MNPDDLEDEMTRLRAEVDALTVLVRVLLGELSYTRRDILQRDALRRGSAAQTALAALNIDPRSLTP